MGNGHVEQLPHAHKTPELVQQTFPILCHRLFDVLLALSRGDFSFRFPAGSVARPRRSGDFFVAYWVLVFDQLTRNQLLSTSWP
jgi:hypothetical protein